MFDIDGIIEQVRRNCTICDSRHAGLFSVCGLAMRLRDLYKWEMGLEPWVERDSAEVLKWIGDKEEAWDLLEEKELSPIAMDGRTYDPFDVAALNRVLEPQGYYYGAGYVHGLRPSFFLGLLERQEELEGRRVYRVGREMARDLLILPALTQGDCIVIRRESARVFLWNQIFFVRKSGRDALNFALKEYGVDSRDHQAIHLNLERILDDELENYLYHELGETKDNVFDRNVWRELIAAFPHTPIELLARAVKDLLADTNEFGRLRHIVRQGRSASLGLYVAFIEGLRKDLFPEITEAFQTFVVKGKWHDIERALSRGYARAKDYAETMMGLFQKGKGQGDLKAARREMERALLGPLGLGTAA